MHQFHRSNTRLHAFQNIDGLRGATADKKIVLSNYSSENSWVRIFDISGKTIVTEAWSSTAGSIRTIDCGRLTAGSCLVEVLQLGGKPRICQIVMQ